MRFRVRMLSRLISDYTGVFCVTRNTTRNTTHNNYVESRVTEVHQCSTVCEQPCWNKSSAPWLDSVIVWTGIYVSIFSCFCVGKLHHQSTVRSYWRLHCYYSNPCDRLVMPGDIIRSDHFHIWFQKQIRHSSFLIKTIQIIRICTYFCICIVSFKFPFCILHFDWLSEYLWRHKACS